MLTNSGGGGGGSKFQCRRSEGRGQNFSAQIFEETPEAAKILVDVYPQNVLSGFMPTLHIKDFNTDTLLYRTG